MNARQLVEACAVYQPSGVGSKLYLVRYEDPQDRENDGADIVFANSDDEAIDTLLTDVLGFEDDDDFSKNHFTFDVKRVLLTRGDKRDHGKDLLSEPR